MRKKRILLSLAAFLLFIQLFQIDRSVPETDPFEDFLTSVTSDDKAVAKSLVQRACYDCHSYQTEYPWYSLFAPISWWLKSHVTGGQQHLNFSLWQQYTAEEKSHKLEECVEEIQEKHMPLKSYTWMHAPSRLTETERVQLISFLKEQLAIIKH